MRLSGVMKSPAALNDEIIEAEYRQLAKIVDELRTKALPAQVTLQINDELARINYFTGSKKDLLKQIRRSQSKIMKLLERKLKLVPKNYYRNTWSFIGIAIFGIPTVLVGLIAGNMGLMTAGVPFGVCLGIVIGLLMDKKAVQNGYQLNL